MKIVAIVLFLVMYVCMLIFSKYRHYIACIVALVFLVLKISPLKEGLEAIDLNVIMMILGTMGTVSFFIDSKMPNKLAGGLLNKCSNVMVVAVVMSLFAGIVSAFIDNVATVLMIAPVGLEIAKKLKISPVPLLICISISANLQGAATLVGDTTSILLAGALNMNFLDFFFMNGKPGIFFSVELGALFTIPVIMFLFRKNKEKVDKQEPTVVSDYLPTILLILTVVLLIVFSFIPQQYKLSSTNGLICMGIYIFGLVYYAIKNRSFSYVKKSIEHLDFDTVCLLMGLFVVIAGISHIGIIQDLANLLVKAGNGNMFVLYTLIVFGSVLCSAFIDNIPYVATMLPVIAAAGASLGSSTPYVLYFGLLVGATLGGNITPIGASANIATIGLLRKSGYEVSTKEFMKYSVPFTIVAVLTGYVFIWLVWA